MANHLKLEQAMIDALEIQYKPDMANAFKSRYFTAKDKLFTDILPWIRTNEPNLTDHSERHIENVLNNAYKLIEHEIKGLLNNPKEHEKSASGLTGLDIYFLCQVILFHDVGNFYGRTKHNLEISKVMRESFNDLFSGEHKREGKLIAEAGRAHCGQGADGTDDTLVDLYSKSEHIQGDHIQFCSIAAIVRFADELAEGPQRTSSLMQDKGWLEESSKIYHKYASCTHIKIDSPNHRIGISYEFDIDTDSGQSQKDIKNALKILLEFTYSRITKLDQERKYYNYYNQVSKPIRETQIVFIFNRNDTEMNTRLEPLIFPGKGTGLPAPSPQIRT